MVWVGEVAKALVSAFEAAEAGTVLDHVVECGPVSSTTIRHVAEIVIDLCEGKGYPRAEIVDLPMRPGEQAGAVVSADAETLRAVGIDPADLVSLETGLERTIDWFIATQGEHWTAPEPLALAVR
jgi:nucleoside-diphosphate-sugar epimerase